MWFGLQTAAHRPMRMWMKEISGIFLDPPITGYVFSLFSSLHFLLLFAFLLWFWSFQEPRPRWPTDPGTALTGSFLEKGEPGLRGASACVNSRLQDMEQEGKEPEKCHSKYKLVCKKQIGRSPSVGKVCDQSWPTMRWLAHSLLGTCRYHTGSCRPCVCAWVWP